MYIWNLIITAPCCFPVNCIVIKVVENSYSMLYQHSNIIGSGGGGGVNNLQKVWGVALLFTIYSIFLDIKKDFYIKKSIPFLDIRTSFFDWKKSISWYQKIDSWNQEIGLIFFYQEVGSIFFYVIGFYFSYQEMDLFFFFQKSIFDIAKHRMNSKTAPQRAVLLFIRYFYLFLI